MKTVTNLAEVKDIKNPIHVHMISQTEIVVYEQGDILPPELVPPPAIEKRLINDFEFRGRFTDSEADAILDLAYSGDKPARKMLLKLSTSNAGVDLDSPDVVNGIAYLTAKGILTKKRGSEILQ